MRRAACGVLVLAGLALPAVTHAQAPGFDVPRGTDVTPGQPTRDGAPSSVGDGPPSPVAPGSGGTTQPPAGRPKVRKKCKRNRRTGTRTCRYYRGATLIRTCVKRRGGRWRCRRASRAGAAVRLNSGFTDPLIPAVGRFYYSGSGSPSKGWCTGTMITRGLVLTAAHCLYDNDDSGTKPDANPNGYYAPSQMSFIPGNTVNAYGQIVANWGEWAIADAYVPNGWANNDGGYDWGIVVLAPNQSGYYAGDYTGTFQAWYNVAVSAGQRLFSAGYPASGGFNSARLAYGGYQYFCDNTWDGDGGYGSNSVFGSSFWILYAPCEMNGGSSGGPVFVPFSDGTWGIIAVNNRGSADASGQYGEVAYKAYFDGRFGQFVAAVFNALGKRHVDGGGDDAGARPVPSPGGRASSPPKVRYEGSLDG